MVYEACGAVLANARHRDLRDTLRSTRTCRAISVSRSLGTFLRPPQPSTVTGPGLSRTSPGHRFRVANHSSSALPDRFPRYEPPLLGFAPTRRGIAAGCVSFEATARLPGLSRWSPTEAEAPNGHRDPSSPGVRCCLPLHRHILRASTPGASGCPGAPSGRRHHPSSLVPPSWFRTTSTVSSARGAAGLLHPAAGPEVRPRFAETRSHRLERRVARGRSASKSVGIRASLLATLLPFEEFPPFPAAPRHRGPIPPCRWIRPGEDAPFAFRCRSAGVTSAKVDTRLRGVAPKTGPLRPMPLQAPGSLVPSMGFCPLRGSTSPDSSWTYQGDPSPPRGLWAAGPWRSGESPRSSRGHPSRAFRPRPSRGVCPGGSFASPSLRMTRRTSMGFSTLKDRSELPPRQDFGAIG
jgi:hypothetical protein